MIFFKKQNPECKLSNIYNYIIIYKHHNNNIFYY